MSCDAELQELMLQVDRMVEDKKNECQDKLRSAESRLSQFLNENSSLRNMLEQKNSEIENLKSCLKIKENQSCTSDYDQEVLQLKIELSQLKKNYDKYQHKYIKKLKESEKNREEIMRQKNLLMKQLAELKSEHNNCASQVNELNDQIDQLTSENKSIVSDKQLLSEQLKSMKIDCDYKSSNYIETEQKYVAQLKSMESKHRESTQHFEKQIEEQRQSLNELMAQSKRNHEDNQKLLIDNESAKRMILRLENELGRLTSELKLKEKSIFKLEQNCRLNDKTITEKNEFIKLLQSSTINKENSAQIIIDLESELNEARNLLKSTKKNEKSLQNDLDNLHKRLKEIEQNKSRDNSYKAEVDEMSSSLKKLEVSNRQLIDDVTKLEFIIQAKSNELLNVTNDRDKLLGELTTIQNKSRESTKFNVSFKDNTNDNAKTPKHNNTFSSDRTPTHFDMKHIQKEMDVLLKLCEEKDCIIHRLQMENRILQDFITKINAQISVGAHMSGDNETSSMMPFNNPELETTSGEYDDHFRTMRETSLLDTMVFDLPPTAQNHSNSIQHHIHEKYPLKSNKESRTTNNSSDGDIPSSSRNVTNKKNNSAFTFENVLQKSSEEFISSLTRDSTDSKKSNGLNDKSNFMTMYPTLAAARYFSEEREKTHQLENIIEYHMSQLRQDVSNADYRRLLRNNTSLTNPTVQSPNS